jgi:hypothetical protein
MTTWEDTQTRIVVEASQIRPAKVFVTVVAAPFFAVGFALMLIWLLLTLLWQAGWVGAQTARTSLKRD